MNNDNGDISDNSISIESADVIEPIEININTRTTTRTRRPCTGYCHRHRKISICTLCVTALLIAISGSIIYSRMSVESQPVPKIARRCYVTDTTIVESLNDRSLIIIRINYYRIFGADMYYGSCVTQILKEELFTRTITCNNMRSNATCIEHVTLNK